MVSSSNINIRSNSGLEQRPSGAYTTLEELINARFVAGDINLQQRRKALSLLAGPNKTNFRGRGLDFEEVRAYQAGDDIRTIDWRVTARSGKAYTKLFREERERPLLIVTDQRQPMFFGSQHCFKSVTACYLSALIAWAGLKNNDRVGGLVFGNDSHQEIRPRRSRQSVLSLCHQLLEFNQALNKHSGVNLEEGETLEQSLIELRRIARPGSTLFLIGDFAGLQQGESEKHLYQLSRHCEITALFVYDPLEQHLPRAGQYTITNGEQRHQIYTGSKRARQDYRQHFEEKKHHLSQQFGRLGIPMINISTEDSPLAVLLQYYGNTHYRGSR